MTRLRILILLVTACCTLAFGKEAEAACPPLAFCTCSVSATGVAFGTYDPFSAAPNEATGTVTVNCTFTITVTTTYEISLSPGNSGSFSERRMSHGASSLTYNLYNSSAQNQIWGDGSGQSQTTTGRVIGVLNHHRAFTVYGRIPTGQNVPPGAYTDTIIATVAY